MKRSTKAKKWTLVPKMTIKWISRYGAWSIEALWQKAHHGATSFHRPISKWISFRTLGPSTSVSSSPPLLHFLSPLLPPMQRSLGMAEGSYLSQRLKCGARGASDANFADDPKGIPHVVSLSIQQISI